MKNTRPTALSGAAVDLSNASVGDYVTFGTYEQDNDLTNGAEPIEWRVLAVDGNKVLLISKYALDAQPYNEEYTDVTWETCTLRSWLNSDFYNTAFTSSEKSSIQTTAVQNPDAYRGYDSDGNYIINNTGTGIKDLQYQVNGGNATSDKVFLLSINEAKTYFDDTAKTLSDGNINPVYPDLQCAPTAYAVAQGASQSSYYTTADGEGCCWWWLRSPGRNASTVSGVYDSGLVDPRDYFGGSDRAIRPALWVTIS